MYDCYLDQTALRIPNLDDERGRNPTIPDKV